MGELCRKRGGPGRGAGGWGLRRGGFHHDEAEGKDDKEVPCLMASIFLNKSGGNHLLRGRGWRGISGKRQNTETTAVRKKRKGVRKEKREGAPRTKLTLWLCKGACRCKAQAYLTGIT